MAEYAYLRVSKPLQLNKRWLGIGLLVSAGVHGLLCLYFSMMKMPEHTAVPPKPEPVKKFNLKRVRIDPPPPSEPLKPTKVAPPRPLDSQQIPVPSDEGSLAGEMSKEIRVTPAPAPEATEFRTSQQPGTDLLAYAKEGIPRQASTGEADKVAETALADNVKGAAGRRLNDQPSAQTTKGDLPALPVGVGPEMSQEDTGFRAGKPAPGSLDNILSGNDQPSSGANLSDLAQDAMEASGTQAGSPGTYSNLDDLLAGSGLKGSEGPILMPTDLLFEYDSSVLRAEAASSIEKLGALIKKNPHAMFIIEGHTDAFGSPDYNQRLSEKRAESVRDWLVASMGIQPTSIETRGLGSSKLLVPSSGTVEQQMLNRRVEIVIRTRQ